MSVDVYADVKRDGVIVHTDKTFQLDRMSEVEAMTYSLPPHFSYDGYHIGILDLRQNDYIVDKVNRDPVTSLPKEYQITNEPESFPDAHVEFQCIRADKAAITR